MSFSLLPVNTAQNVVSLLSVPRDLYVAIPERGMGRINTAYGYGEQDKPGFGADLLIETLHHTLGLEIDYYARVDFEGFKQIIDSVGGVEIAVDCAIEDWQLKTPDLDPTLEENWELNTLPIGVHFVDGNRALWYVRSRRTSSDFDRGRRQQAVIKALWRNVRTLGLLDQLTDLWPQLLEIVDTNIALHDLLPLLSIATDLAANRVVSYTFRLNYEVENWQTPEGSSVLLPVPDRIAILVNEFLNPPLAHQSRLIQPSIRITNASGRLDFSRIAADRLAWEGFMVEYDEEITGSRQFTTIYDYTGQTKGSNLEMLKTLFHVSDEMVRIEPDSDRLYDYEVVLGNSYYPCTYDVIPPGAS